jgi:hypothetical protein
MMSFPNEKTQFKPGQSGNPNGRPKMPDLSEAISKVLADEKDGKTALDAVLMALRNKAVKGDVRAAQELLDRAFGKSKQSIDHSGKVDTSPQFDISKLDDNELRTLAELQRKGGTSKA